MAVVETLRADLVVVNVKCHPSENYATLVSGCYPRYVAILPEHLQNSVQRAIKVNIILAVVTSASSLTRFCKNSLIDQLNYSEIQKVNLV